MKQRLLLWLWFVAIVALAVAPFLLSDFRLNLLGRFLALAILAIGIDLIWGYTGILSLGHGLYFGLGAYAMGMYLKLEATGGSPPDFMVWNGIEKLPLIWKPFSNFTFSLAFAVVVPAILAVIIGYVAFRSRIRGPYFSILSQALVLIAVTSLVAQQAYTGGTNGITDFRTLFGYSLADGTVQRVLYGFTAGILLLVLWGSLRLVRSRFGMILVAIRDGENRLRFLGHNPTVYKVAVYALSAAMAGLAGALYVPQVGIISPAMIGVIPSIEMVLWVALGGKGTLVGALLGTLLVNSAKTAFSESFPEFWSYLIGFLFVLNILVFPSGFVGLIRHVGSMMARRTLHVEQARGG